MSDVPRICHTCKFAVKNPAANNWLCQHPNLPAMKLDPQMAAFGVPGVSASMVSGYSSYQYDGPSCTTKFAWWEPKP